MLKLAGAVSLFVCIAGAFAQARNYRAAGPVSSFTLPSEVRILPMPMKSTPLTLAGLAKDEIAITIDDGPSEHTPEVLQILREHGVKATFFLIGKNVVKYPRYVKMILEEGHSVGNHTWDHKAMDKISLKAAEQEIAQTKRVLDKVSAATNLPIQPFFRFPEGAGADNASLKALVQKFGMANFYWRMSVHDSRTKNTDVVLNTAMGMLDTYDGGIILLHETHPWTREMLPYFLQELHVRNYKTIYFQAKGVGN